MPQSVILQGQTLAFTADPFRSAPASSAQYHGRGAVLIEDGLIADSGDADIISAKYPTVRRRDFGRDLILAGFIDAHAHYPQSAIIASWGKRLLDWLNNYTFPEEEKFGDPDYAAGIAGFYLDRLIAHGTTTVCSFCTTHWQSADAFFAQAEQRRMRVLAGKTCMDRNAPAALLDTAASAYGDSRRLLRKWHQRGRLSYVITPRFAPTSTPEQLHTLGELWQEYPDCLMQTHLSEQAEEIELVRKLFPDARDYVDVYDAYGLLGPRGLYGHAIHLGRRERSRILEAGGALIHCPTSNLFIGSGLFDVAACKAEGQRVGLATDTGGGSSYSMLRTMAAAYEISQLKGAPLHPVQLLWLATAGNAEALHLQSEIGNLLPGMEADLAVLDLHSTEAIALRAARAGDIWEEVF
ncbi:MAG: guanine deaminase, partial [Rhodobacteraceae bacterium]|nr:guanine deaminase [Paracoccaceae bacterium]